MKKNITWILALLFAVSIGACLGTGDPKEDIVITRLENVKPEVIQQIGTIPDAEDPPAIIVNIKEIADELSLKTVQKFMPGIESVVFTERQFLKEEFQSSKDLSQVISLSIPSFINKETGQVEIDTPKTANAIAGIASSIFPPLTPFLPLLGLIPWGAKKRSRKHLKKAVKKIVPTDGTVDFAGAFQSFSKAVGWDHSSDDPDELENIAKKIRVNKAVKNGDLEDLHDTLIFSDTQ